MKRKHKFVTTFISSLVLLSLLMLGVYATVTRQVSITGQITFVGVQVNADVVVTSTQILPPEIEINAGHYGYLDNNKTKSTLELRIGGNQDGKNFNLGNIEFTDTLTIFSFKIEITSKMQGQALLQVEYTNNIEPKDFPSEYFDRVEKLERIKEGVTTPVVGQWDNIEPNETIVWTVTFTVKNPSATPDIDLLERINESFTIKRYTAPED